MAGAKSLVWVGSFLGASKDPSRRDDTVGEEHTSRSTHEAVDQGVAMPDVQVTRRGLCSQSRLDAIGRLPHFEGRGAVSQGVRYGFCNDGPVRGERPWSRVTDAGNEKRRAQLPVEHEGEGQQVSSFALHREHPGLISDG
jgi:hypothetical protein